MQPERAAISIKGNRRTEHLRNGAGMTVVGEANPCTVHATDHPTPTRPRMPPRFSLLPLALVLGAASCGSDGPTGPAFGDRMSVGDQVAIEAALNKLADTLETRGE